VETSLVDLRDKFKSTRATHISITMELGSKQDGVVVNTTRAIEALSPWLNKPRRTIVQVEALVVTAAALLLLQLIFGHCKRRWHNSFVRGVLLACNTVMFPLILYTLSIMQSSPIKNSSYPIWAVFLIMASDGTLTLRQYDFYGSALKKFGQAAVEFGRYSFYAMMFSVLMSPLTWKENWTKMGMPNKYSSSTWVQVLIFAVLLTKITEGVSLFFWETVDLLKCRAVTEQMRMEKWANDHPSDSDPESMEGYDYPVQFSSVTIGQIWERCGNSDDGKALKDICLSFALFQLLKRRYFGLACAEARHPKTRHFVLKKLLPSEQEYERAFRVVEVELGFCYDHFFTRYGFFYAHANFRTPIRKLQIPGLLFLFLTLYGVKIICIFGVGVFAFRKSMVLETPDPIIEVHITSADHIITLLVVGIALIVQLLQVAFYLASDWVQVSLACMYVKKNFYGPNAFIGKIIGFLRRVTISGAWRNKIDQRSIFGNVGPVEVSDTVKRAIARSLISTEGILTNGETSLRQNQNLSWTLKNHSQLEIMLIWHVATEYCALSEDHRNGTTTRGAALNLSRYTVYLMVSVPELLPYHEVDINESLRELVVDKVRCEGWPWSYEN
jgi:hypothetical protein